MLTWVCRYASRSSWRLASSSAEIGVALTVYPVICRHGRHQKVVDGVHAVALFTLGDVFAANTR